MKNIIGCMFLVIALALASGANAQSEYSNTSGWFGALSAGGSLVSASANTLGGLGHFSFGIDGSYMHPEVSGDNYSASGYSTVFRMGISQGATLGPGLHGVGSLDAYFKAGQMFLSGEEGTDVSHVGGGVRLGILRNSITSPALSVTVGYHKTGGLDIITLPTDINNPEVEVSTWAIRADISKNLFVITPYAGIGINLSNVDVTGSGIKWDGEENETVIYGGLEWNLLLLHIGIEVGNSGGDTYGKLGGRVAL